MHQRQMHQLRLFKIPPAVLGSPPAAEDSAFEGSRKRCQAEWTTAEKSYPERTAQHLAEENPAEVSAIRGCTRNPAQPAAGNRHTPQQAPEACHHLGALHVGKHALPETHPDCRVSGYTDRVSGLWGHAEHHPDVSRDWYIGGTSSAVSRSYKEDWKGWGIIKVLNLGPCYYKKKITSLDSSNLFFYHYKKINFNVL